MRPGRAADIGQMQKAENIEAAVDADDNNIAAARQIGAVGHRAVARPITEGAAMQPHHDRPLDAVAEAGCPHIQAQTIFALGARVRRPEKGFEHRPPRGAIGQLPCAAGIGDRRAHAAPGLRRFGRHEAVAPRRRSAVGDALERVNAGGRYPAQFACGDFDDGCQASLRGGDVIGHSLPSAMSKSEPSPKELPPPPAGGYDDQ